MYDTTVTNTVWAHQTTRFSINIFGIASIPPLLLLALSLMDRYLGFIIAQGGVISYVTHAPGVETTLAISGAVFTNIQPDFFTRDCYRYFK